MSNHEEVKELLQKKKLKQVFLIALSNSLKLKLTTSFRSKNTIDNIETQINLLTGLTTKISASALNSSDNNGLKFHQKQVENAYETWDKNRETLVKLLQIIAGNDVEITSFSTESSQELLPLITSENGTSQTNFEDDFIDFESNSPLEDVLNVDENQEYEEEANWIDEINDIENITEEAEINDIENITEEVEINEEELEDFDDISLDLDMMAETEEEIVITENNMEEEEEENWDNLMDEMPEEEGIFIKEEVVINGVVEDNSPSLEVDNDWEEWLEEDDNTNSSNHKEEFESQDIDWEEEDWEEEEEIN